MAFKTKEEIEISRIRQNVELLGAAISDNQKREENARTLITGRLAEPPVKKMLKVDGVEVSTVSLRVMREGKDYPATCSYVIPRHERLDGFGRDNLDARVSALQAGDEVSLLGRWEERKWKNRSGEDKKTWVFATGFFEAGDRSIDNILSLSTNRLAQYRDIVSGIVPAGTEIPSLASASDKPAALPSLRYTSGNVVNDTADVLVNTVNSQLSPSGKGVMGKGVALDFKEKYPSIMKDYENAIKSGELKPGRALLFDLPDGRKWAALATKDTWQEKSQEDWVDAGLKELGEKVRAAGLNSIALPPPGCGNGGLDWKRVEPMVHKHLHGIEVAMYAKPSGAMAPLDIEKTPGFDPKPFNNAKSLALSALSAGARGASASISSNNDQDSGPKKWSKQELLTEIPNLLKMVPFNSYVAYSGIGSRETPVDVLHDMEAMARVMEARGLTGRSGAADGADTAFEKGAMDIGRKFEVFLPWASFDKRSSDTIPNRAPTTLMDKKTEVQAREIASKFHEAWNKTRPGPNGEQVPVLSNGAKSLHTRNVPQVLGKNLDSPVKFVMCWGKPKGDEVQGGTGQAVRIANAYGIPVLNLHDQDIRNAILKELGLSAQRDLQKDRIVAESQRSLHNQTFFDSPEKEKEKVSSSGEKTSSVKEFDLTRPSVRSRNKDDVAYFCKVADPLGSLSNMHNGQPIYVDGVKWKSSEALYQALRFPHNPELQEKIRLESNAFTAKKLAHEHKAETRPDWEEVNEQAMAWVVTLKKDQSALFRSELESTQGKDIVELSVKDEFWGAKPKGDQLVGRDVLGNILTQLRDGARMDEPPAGSLLLGRPVEANAERSAPESAIQRDALEIPEPSMKASMYFKYGNSRREGFTAETTFDAILKGERTSTTRYKEWGALERWEKLSPGSVVRFYEDKEMRGRSVDVVVTSLQRVSLREMDDRQLDEWSKVEGWSVAHGRVSARKYSEGVQIRYALPDSPEGRRALGKEISSEPDVARQQPVYERSEPSQVKPAAQAAQKNLWMSALSR